jgi:hypothetical protein
MKLLLLLLTVIMVAPQQVSASANGAYMFDTDECYERIDGDLKEQIGNAVACSSFSQVHVYKATGGYTKVDRRQVKNACDISRYDSRKSVHIATSQDTRSVIIARYDLVDEDVPQNIDEEDVLLICPHTGEKQRAKEAQEKEIEKIVAEKVKDELNRQKSDSDTSTPNPAVTANETETIETEDQKRLQLLVMIIELLKRVAELQAEINAR